MALPSSGAISIGTIATEFGGTTPHSMSEYYSGGSYVPINAYSNVGPTTVPTTGPLKFSNFYGTSRSSNSWITQVYLSEDTLLTSGRTGHATSINNNRQSYTLLVNNIRTEGTFFKTEANGSIAWQRSIPPVTSPYSTADVRYGQVFDVATSSQSSGDVYILLQAWKTEYYLPYNGTYSVYEPVVMKYNSSGVLQWQRRYYMFNGYVHYASTSAEFLGCDSSSNLYVAYGANPLGTEIDTDSEYCGIMKISPTAGIVWQRNYVGDNGTGYGGGYVTAGGNTYYTAQYSNTVVVVTKRDGNGTLIWARSQPGTTIGRVYGTLSESVLYLSEGASVRKISRISPSDGSIIWTRSVYDPYYSAWPSGTQGSSHFVDEATGNLYIQHYNGEIFRYTPSGVYSSVACVNNSPTGVFFYPVGGSSDGTRVTYVGSAANGQMMILSSMPMLGKIGTYVLNKASQTIRLSNTIPSTLIEAANTTTFNTIAISDQAGPLYAETTTITETAGGWLSSIISI